MSLLLRTKLTKWGSVTHYHHPQRMELSIPTFRSGGPFLAAATGHPPSCSPCHHCITVSTAEVLGRSIKLNHTCLRDPTLVLQECYR